MGKAAVYLDFQGTLGGAGTDDIRTLELYPFSTEAIHMLNDAGVLAIGMTNQSHIAKGELTLEEYDAKLWLLEQELAEQGAHLDAVYMCPHGREDRCACKKPATGMIEAARRDFDIDPRRQYVVGDMGMSDIALAHNAGAKGVLVLTGVGQGSLGAFRHTWAGLETDHVAENVREAVRWILQDMQRYQILKNVSLKPRTLENVKIFWEASQDEEIKRLFPSSTSTLDEAIALYEESLKPNARSCGKVIYVDDKYIGDIWCYEIDENEDKQAFVSIVIFNKSYLGMGIGKQALTQFCHLIFERYNIDKLCAFTYGTNQRSIGALESVGFKKIEEFMEDGVLSYYYELIDTVKESV